MTHTTEKSSLYSKIADLLQAARQNVVRAVNQTMVYTYFEIGRMIVEDEQQGKERAEYGKQVLKELSRQLSIEFGKGFSVDNLQNMRQFFLTYSNYETTSRISSVPDTAIPSTGRNALQNTETYELSISETVSRKFILSWSHYLKLMRIENPDERSFYEIECASNNWSLKELQRQFDSALYERLALSRDKEGIRKLAEKGQLIEKPADLLKDPYILEFLDLPEQHQYSESDLETAILDKLEIFLLELGKGFTFVARQFRMTIDEKHFKADLVFFNRILKCFVVIDLKIGELTHQDIGQIQMYVNYHDRLVKLPDENKTIGIVLCKDKNETLVEYTLPENNDQIFASRYKTILPDKQTFIQLLKKNYV
jgi:predicted nuclease of restriction endonuclease-like (RecB) superfamily